MFGNPLTNDKKWNTMKMKEVAPSTSYSGAVSECDDGYWLLNLDMIESNTGRIISKVFVPKEEIGQSTTSFSSEYVLFSKLRPYLNKVVIPDAAGYATTELVTLFYYERVLEFRCDSSSGRTTRTVCNLCPADR